ncbi:MAG: alpha/beta hydrolase [Bacteroidetes bacterium]|nr:MAG: alpha/beta hydrolase [Bacteroidota bacterium]
MTTNTMVKSNPRIEHLETESPKNGNNGPIPYPKILRLIRFGFGTLGRVFPGPASNYALKLFGTPRFRARHKTSDPILESARNFEFSSRGLNLKGYEWGNGDHFILLVHGWESRGTALRTFVPDLVNAGFKVVTFDAPAHGDSPGNRTHIVDFAEAISDLLKTKGNPYGIITHSLGGAATIFAFHRLAHELEAKKVALIASPRNIQDPINEAIETLNLPGNVSQRFVNKIEDILKLSVTETTLANAAGKVNIENLLLIHDMNDKVVPFRAAETNFAAFKNSKLVTTQGLGHYLLIKDPKVIHKVTEFISS